MAEQSNAYARGCRVRPVVGGVGDHARGQGSIIITTYKRHDLLVRAIRSALDQTIKDTLVLVVDDGGGLPDLRMFASDPRLFACSLSDDMGFVSLGKNVGIRLTRLKYVAFLDDDNTWEPGHLAVALGALEGQRSSAAPGYVYTAVMRNFPDGRLYDILSVDFDRRFMAAIIMSTQMQW